MTREQPNIALGSRQRVPECPSTPRRFELVIAAALPEGDVDQVDVLVGFVTNSRYGLTYSPFEVSMIRRAAAGWIHKQHERIVDEGL
jgi:hypothetical protein